MIKIGVSGASGRMGQRIIRLIKEDSDIILTFGLECKGHPDIGKSIEKVTITDDCDIIKECDCLIDFSLPQALSEHVSFLVKFEKSAVIGTTGLDKKQIDLIASASKDIPIVFSPNMSVGVNLMFRLLKEAAGILGGYDVNIKEAHHMHKKDAPSGTAKKIAQIINSQGFNIKIEDIKAIREDEIVGDHKVVFNSDLDTITLSHSAKTRDIFVKGAILAAKWVAKKNPGLYSMDDVLFEN